MLVWAHDVEVGLISIVLLTLDGIFCVGKVHSRGALCGHHVLLVLKIVSRYCILNMTS